MMLALAIIATIVVGEGLLLLFCIVFDETDDAVDTWMCINACIIVGTIILGAIFGVFMLWEAAL